MSQVVSKSQASPRPRLNKYGYNCIGKHIGMVFFVCAPLFVAAGTLQWDWAWVYSAVTLLGWIALSLVLARVNPELLNERGKQVKQQTGTKSWDWIIMAVYSVLLMATPIIAGLDYRYTWSSPASDGIKIIGAGVLAVSFVPLTWSMAVNRFFAPTVRIQADRGQRVTTTGPYRYVRHPGYLGVILQFISIPFSLATWSAGIPALLGVAVYVIRTALEDRTLQAELPGYADYAHKTRYRLLPGVW